MRSLLRIFACWCGAALLSLPLVAQQLPDQMSPPRLVNDFAGLLDEAQRRSLEQKLADFDRETSTQITVVTVDDLDGYAPADYAQRLHDKWGVGRKGKDNGILILVKPSQPDSRGEAYISVGYGLEGVIPDITAGRILDQEMIPEFRRGSVYDGLDKATNVLMQLSCGGIHGRSVCRSRRRRRSRRRAGSDSGAFLFVCRRPQWRRAWRQRQPRRGGWFPRFSWAAGRVAEAVSEAEVSAVSEAECRAAAEPDVPGRFDNEQ